MLEILLNSYIKDVLKITIDCKDVQLKNLNKNSFCFVGLNLYNILRMLPNFVNMFFISTKLFQYHCKVRLGSKNFILKDSFDKEVFIKDMFLCIDILENERILEICSKYSMVEIVPSFSIFCFHIQCDNYKYEEGKFNLIEKVSSQSKKWKEDNLWKINKLLLQHQWIFEDDEKIKQLTNGSIKNENYFILFEPKFQG